MYATRSRGYAITVDPDGPTVEQDSLTCVHCNSVFFLMPRQDPSDAGGFCRLCYGYICSKCADSGECTPFEKKLEQMEARGRLLKACGL
jgi:hypothetical protein